MPTTAATTPPSQAGQAALPTHLQQWGDDINDLNPKPTLRFLFQNVNGLCPDPNDNQWQSLSDESLEPNIVCACETIINWRDKKRRHTL